MTAKIYISLILASTSCLGIFAQDTGVTVNDESQYDSSFVQYYNYLDNWGVRIIEDSIIVGGDISDPIIIPTELPLNESLNYASEKDGKNWSLAVKRVSYTDVEFSIRGSESDSIIFQGNGIAVLSPTFHLACAGVYERSDEEAFGMNNYPFTSGNIEFGAILIPERTTEMIGYSHRINGEEIILRFLRE